MTLFRPGRTRTLLAAVLLLVSTGPGASAGPFDGHLVVSVTVSTEQELALVESLVENIWSCHVGLGQLDVQVTPQQWQQLQQSGLPVSPWIDDLDTLVERQYVRLRGADWHLSYHDLDEIESRLSEYIADYSAIASAQNFGTSLEGRLLRGIRITGPGNGSDKPAIFFHGGQHAREWVSPASVMWIIEWLLANYGADALATRLIDDMEWFILPVMNPDGYAYTWLSEANRFWRKNRRNNGNGTFGVDLNRNWGQDWGGSGSSGTPGSDTYRGTAPFSEPETQALRDFVVAHPNIVAYIDFHSYSELLLWPWGGTDALCPDNDAFDEIGSDMMSRLLGVHGHAYRAGPTYTTIYPASGIGSDWAYAAATDRFLAAYGIELRDTGSFGFALPPEYIIPTAEENLEAVLALARAMSESLQVELVEPLPQPARPGETAIITVEVTPGFNGAAAPDTVTLYYHTGDGPVSTVTMAPIGANRYEGLATPGGCDGPFSFYVRATADVGAGGYYPDFAPRETATIPVYVSSSVVLYDDLESESGWTVGDLGDNATAGHWVRVDPNGTAAQPEDDHTPAPGTQCFVTGQGPIGGGVGQADVDGGKTTLFSPVFAVPDANSTISYARWYSNNQGSAPYEDVMVVALSSDGGLNWAHVETVFINAGAWVVHSFTPAQLSVAAGNQMKLRFVASDYGAGSIVEAGIDDLSVVQSICSPADGDADGNDAVELIDHAYIADCLFGPSVHGVGASCAVFNLDYDTDVDMDDYLLFLQRFGAAQ